MQTKSMLTFFIAAMVATLNLVASFRPQPSPRMNFNCRSSPRMIQDTTRDGNDSPIVSTPSLHVPNSLSSARHPLPKTVFDARRVLPLAAAVGALSLAAPAFASDYISAITDPASNTGFVQSFLLIFVSEIGDKTFFIAGLLAAKYGRLISFTGSIGALAVMTVISTVLGQIFHAVPSSLTQGIPFDDYIAVAAFTYFGVKTLIDASKLDIDDSSGIEEERAEAVEIVEEISAKEKMTSVLALVLQTFSLVFAAEIGDRSFLSTIALSAALNPVFVALGAIAAHASATGLAVISGAILSKYLSEKVIGYIGGSLFIIFAITTAIGVF